MIYWYPTKGVIRQVWGNTGRKNQTRTSLSSFSLHGFSFLDFCSNRCTQFSFLPCRFSLFLICKVLIDIINVNGYIQMCMILSRVDQFKVHMQLIVCTCIIYKIAHVYITCKIGKQIIYKCMHFYSGFNNWKSHFCDSI